MNKFKIGDIVYRDKNYNTTNLIKDGAIGIVLENDDVPFIDWEYNYSDVSSNYLYHVPHEGNMWAEMENYLVKIGEL